MPESLVVIPRDPRRGRACGDKVGGRIRDRNLRLCSRRYVTRRASARCRCALRALGGGSRGRIRPLEQLRSEMATIGLGAPETAVRRDDRRSGIGIVSPMAPTLLLSRQCLQLDGPQASAREAQTGDEATVGCQSPGPGLPTKERSSAASRVLCCQSVTDPGASVTEALDLRDRPPGRLLAPGFRGPSWRSPGAVI